MGCHSSKHLPRELREIDLLPTKICPACKQQNTQRGWCQPCEIKRFKDDFHNWTSGNNDLDNIIRHSQLNTTGPLMFLEWIPYDKFENIKEIDRGGFGVVYKATWDLGPKLYWDDSRRYWVREGEKQVVLKRLHNSNNANAEFWNELDRHRYKQNKYIPRCYGFSRCPSTKDYVLVLELLDGDLRHHLKKNFVDITWEKKLGIVYNIAHGLMTIHNAGLIHRNFHSGNILRHFNGSQFLTYITDLGQYKPANKQNYDDVYGVLAYVAPEVLRGEEYTEASDVYSFSIIMWEIASGQKPFYDRPHNAELAREICNGLRPSIIMETPQCYVELMEKCWNADPKERPDIRELEKSLMSWGWHMGMSQKHSVSDQFISAEKERLRLLEHLGSQLEPFKKPHPESFYKSRLLNFPDLPKPRNLYDSTSDSKDQISGISSDDDNTVTKYQ